MPIDGRIDSSSSSFVDGRWFAVGRSHLSDARAAGLEAASGSLAGHDDAKLLVVFCSDSYDLEALLAGINERSGGVPLIGCSTAGEISASGAGDASVVVSALGGPGFAVATAVATDSSKDLRGAGAAASSCIGTVDAEHRVLLLLTDGLSGDHLISATPTRRLRRTPLRDSCGLTVMTYCF